MPPSSVPPGSPSMGERKHRPAMRRTARQTFGFELRPEQERAISSVLDGRDTLVLMPTGSGKSAIFQVACLLLPGPAVVISPLLALQRDQIESLQGTEQVAAAAVNSSVRQAEREEALDRFADGSLRFLYIAPEQFQRADVLERVKAGRPALFVVDEAHCVSEWGDDFRPEYLRLGGVIDELGHPTVLALTATASPRVREQIMERLSMVRPAVLVSGFDGPNI